MEQNATIAQPPSQLDEAVFACSVEPILARQCSYSACHGQASSPLRVYSPGKLRQTPPGDIDASAAPLTQAEHDANFAAASGFGVGQATVDDNFLLKKPLPSTFGGFEHTGGAIFSGTDDPQYVAIRAWLAGTGSCP
nr:hypothetical protein [Kofleriaceae bacterium]